MSAGNQFRQTAEQARRWASQHREQAAGMHKTALELERHAENLVIEAAKLDALAKHSDDEERLSLEKLTKLDKK